MLDFSRPRGTRDFKPEEMRARRKVESIMRNTLSSYGYEEIATPTFEYSDLFIARSGPQILEQIYDFKDKGDRDLVLRPELTAPVMRMYNSDLKSRPKPLRLQYFGNCFRYERPQKGRYREFWQLGLEYIGKRTPSANAEVINAAVSSLDAVGLRNYVVRIGHVSILRSLLYALGVEEDKELMIAIDKKNIDLLEKRFPEVEGSRVIKDMIAKPFKVKNTVEIMNKLSNAFPNIDKGPISELIEVIGLVSSENGTIELDISITRGLDYYDGIVFEIDAPSLGAEKQICGGGAYSLTSVFGTEIEGIGFGLGFDRILVSLGDALEIEKDRMKICLRSMEEGDMKLTIRASKMIRSTGVTCLMETSKRPFKKVINYALSTGCTHLAILGEDEIRRGGVSIKNLSTKEQVFVEMNDLIDRLEEL
ncbi:MAG: histidine--tRNA ligase [Candidatus Thermoplasmatota archaeon]|nr:histidine--tRNA ligase [Candidatus Thermoplasmatota archaeon]